ncbi:MAG: Glu-tRNA(Gln) amidotransferase subunit GatD [Thermoplasmata archaeon]|nr:Glu-tRNA(Gln) amidotransferase subunit GatD [Thermoplasmata archaeon]
MSDPVTEDPWPLLSALSMGRRVEVRDPAGSTWRGTVVPRHGFSGDRILQLKLASGYNVGLRIGPDFSFRPLEDPAPSPAGAPKVPSSAMPPPSGPWVGLLTTGGTIASRVDYETGGVRPVSGESEILAFYPELQRTGAVHILPVFDRLSEEFRPEDWAELGTHVVETFRSGACGVVIAHGTDTLSFTAAALSFLLVNLPGPVVLVGAQRSPDRPSSDGPSNLDAAVQVARDGRIGEVVVVMHAGPSDTRFAIHRGNWVRKMHSSRRDAFESRNGPVLGWVEEGQVSLAGAVKPPAVGPAVCDLPIDTHAGLLWFYPGLAPEGAAAFARGLRGIILAGTGLGHVSSAHFDWIREAVRHGVVVAMTTQCLGGVADPYVYATGRELLGAGVLYLDDLLPETAYAKLVWALGHSPTPDGVRALLRAPRAGEFLERHLGGAPP